MYGMCGGSDWSYGFKAQFPYPIRVFQTVKIKKLIAGRYHAMLLTHDGSVIVWGAAELGQLGLGTRSMDAVEREPKKIVDLPKIVDIAVGYDHSLALSGIASVCVCVCACVLLCIVVYCCVLLCIVV